MIDAVSYHSDSGSLELLDQTLLPRQVIYRVLNTVEQVNDAIRDMVVRGAPAIGVPCTALRVAPGAAP